MNTTTSRGARVSACIVTILCSGLLGFIICYTSMDRPTSIQEDSIHLTDPLGIR